MPHTFEEAEKIVFELPEDQRILLANSIWDSIGQAESDATETEVNAAWDPEIGRRVAEIKAGTAVTYSAEEVEADLRAIVGN